jgi:Holliday junction DNA helicase RuvA
MYFKITSVAGVGAKAALGLLSVMSPSQLAVAIISEDITSLTRAAGVGKKVAARIVMELKEKLAESSDFAAETVAKSQGTISDGILSESAEAKRDAADALAALGYSRSDAVKATLEVSSDGMTSEQIIKAALKKLNR